MKILQIHLEHYRKTRELARTDMVAISATFFIQYLLFCIGLDDLSSFSGPGLVTTATCWLTMLFVPRILAKFGYSSGTASVLSAAGSVVNSGMAFIK